MAHSWRGAVDALISDLQHIFDGRLQSVVVYGTHAEHDGHEAAIQCLATVRPLTATDQHACASKAGGWHRRNLATPLVLPTDEFFRSLDAFPLEYGEIIRAHVLVHGDDPFANATISRDDLRRACETQVKSHLVHLRESFI